MASMMPRGTRFSMSLRLAAAMKRSIGIFFSSCRCHTRAGPRPTRHHRAYPIVTDSPLSGRHFLTWRWPALIPRRRRIYRDDDVDISYSGLGRRITVVRVADRLRRQRRQRVPRDFTAQDEVTGEIGFRVPIPHQADRSVLGNGAQPLWRRGRKLVERRQTCGRRRRALDSDVAKGMHRSDDEALLFTELDSAVLELRFRNW